MGDMIAGLKKIASYGIKAKLKAGIIYIPKYAGRGYVLHDALDVSNFLVRVKTDLLEDQIERMKEASGYYGS